MSPEAINSLMVLSFGFSVAGLLASGYQLVTAEPPSFLILGDGARPKAVASVLFLVFAAPFIIMRNTVRGTRHRAAQFPRHHGFDRDRRFLEPDVGHRARDGDCRRSAWSRPESSRLQKRCGQPWGKGWPLANPVWGRGGVGT